MCLVNHTEIKKGFTLAEVLVTLAIIGVVAALTIPALINNTSDKQLYVKLKKNYSVLNQAVKSLEVKNGAIDLASDSEATDDLATVMNFIKRDSWVNLAVSPFNTYKCYKNTANTISGDSCSNSATTSDGSVLCIDVTSADCSASSGTLAGICGRFFIDVNGAQAPNMAGKDYFYLWLVKEKGSYVVYPGGSNGDGLNCVAGNVGGGKANWGCAKYALTRTPSTMP